jgi:hypothetical protein
MFNNRYVRTALVVGTVTALLLAVFAYANSTDITAGGLAGYGEEAIPGFTVSSYSYSLNSANPTYVSSWTVVLSTAATTMYSRLGSSGTAIAWAACVGDVSKTTWTCTPATTTTVLVADALNLQISAVKNSP